MMETAPLPAGRTAARALRDGVFAVFAFATVASLVLSPALARAATATPEPSASEVLRHDRGALTIEVAGVRTSIGSIRVDVCTVGSFLKDACPYSAATRATAGSTIVSIAGVPPGVYAVQLFHDENDNQRVDRGLFGLPTEAIGFSNDASVGLTGPSFAKAAFNHGGETQRLKVTLRRFGPAKG